MGLFDTFKKSVSAKDQANTATQKANASTAARNPNTDQSSDAIVVAGREPAAITHKLLFVGTPADWSRVIDRDLHRLQQSWGFQFVPDAAQAVAALHEEFHAIIIQAAVAAESTVAEALKKVPAKTVRVVLCDTSDRSEVARWSVTGANPVSQSTDASNLAATINRTARVQEWMTDAGIKKLLALCKKLPAMPKLYSQVSKELSSPNGSIDVVAQLIAQDPVMTAKILQVVNSAFFALGRQVSEPADAVMFLGAERTRSLILLAGVFTQFDGVGCPGFMPEPIWNHSLQVGALARTITMAETKNAKLAEAAFTAGLVHDMGKLILAANVPAMCNSIGQLHKSKQLTQREAETQVLGTTHAELAACLLGSWGLPLPVLEAVAWHHHPTRSPDKGFTLLTAVHAANVFAYEVGCGSGTAALPETFDHPYLLQIGLGDNRNDWRKACNVPQRIEEDAEHAKFRMRRDAKIK
jgi:HD-like signal output (HDOD) protein